MANYEIEIKSLLGAPEHSKALLDKLSAKFPDMQLRGKEKQLNHYFVGGEIHKVPEAVGTHLNDEQKTDLESIAREGKKHSLRTRQANDRVIVVVKASVDDTTSANGIARREFEADLPVSLDELDNLLLEAGYDYQSKWSRDREEYQCGDTTVCVDFTPGYGHVAEFERVVSDDQEAEAIQADLRNLMNELGVEELAQDRLERMFAHYNTVWPDYYGTDKVFTIE